VDCAGFQKKPDRPAIHRPEIWTSFSRQHHLHPRWMVNPPSQPLFPKEKRRPGLALRPYRYRRCRPQSYSFRNGNRADWGGGTEICRRL
jgi:hypothetical protein